MSIVQVFYISRCDSAVTPTDVHRIVGSSQVRNRRRDVTGLLAYSGRHFVQVVEGKASEIDGLLNAISGDPRHRDMVVLQRLHGVPRRFGDWSMHLVDSVARVDEIEQLFVEAANAATSGAPQQLLEGIVADAQWQRADDLSP